MNARVRHTLQRRLARIEKRLEASRGTCMNMSWLHWMDVYWECYQELFPNWKMDELDREITARGEREEGISTREHFMLVVERGDHPDV